MALNLSVRDISAGSTKSFGRDCSDIASAADSLLALQGCRCTS